MKKPETSQFSAQLVRKQQVTPSTYEFTFRAEPHRDVQFRPGQFFRFTFTDDRGEFERSYSLCNVAPGGSELELVVSRVEQGRATEVLFSAALGLEVNVSGPFGRLLIPEPLPQRLFLVATSVGIAPYIPMLTPLAEAADNGATEVTLLFGIRDPDEYLYAQRLQEFAGHPGVCVEVCYSRQLPGVPSPQDFAGYVNDRLVAHAPDPQRDHVLLCGNPLMIDDCFSLLRKAGFKGKSVTREKYVFAKDPLPVGSAPAVSAADKELIAAKLAALRDKG